MPTLDNICPYFTRFPLSFPMRYLEDATPGQWVLDPFCGGGTALFAARTLGLHAAGLDANPVAVAISQAKLEATSLDDAMARAKFICDSTEETDMPEHPFWRGAYTPEVLRLLSRFRRHFQMPTSHPADALLRGLLLGILHGPRHDGKKSYLSNHLPATYAPNPEKALTCWREQGWTAPQCSLLACLEQHALPLLAAAPPCVKGVVIQGDSRQDLERRIPHKISRIITSPPYFGMDLFHSLQWMRAWLLGGPPLPEPPPQTGIRHQSVNAYTEDLAAVWKQVAALSRPGAQLTVRMGSVANAAAPSPDALFEQSLYQAREGWTMTSCVHAPLQRRPASIPGFDPPTLRPEMELEMTARLK